MAESIVINCDCMEYMKTLPDNAFDLAVVDPPYGDALEHTQRRHGTDSDNDATSTKPLRFHGGDRRNKYLPIDHLHSSYRKIERENAVNRANWHGKDKYYLGQQNRRANGDEVRNKIISWDVAPEQEYFEELFRVSRNQIIWGGNYFPLPPTRCFLIWRKTNIPLEGFSMAPCEYAWTSFNENARVFEHSSLRGQGAGKFHPTEKPVELYRWIYQHFARPGYRIIDTHLGSGSSRIAAFDAGLDFTGCEIDQVYFQKQEERFEQHTAQQSLFVSDDAEQCEMRLEKE